MKRARLTKHLLEPILKPLLTPLTSAITAALGGGIKPKPGDYLLTAFGGDYLTDELGNRLTA